MAEPLTLAQTISAATRVHLLKRRGLLFGQCVTAVGWVGGTVPELPQCPNPAVEGGIVELPTADVAGPGFVVGAALAGRRPIFVCRYQGFMWYNAATLVNYAAKSKELWGISCPLFIRAIAMEGGIGPVATGAHHSMVMRMPGIKVAAPMTPQEWLAVWDDFLAGDDPVYCSEHRLSYPSTDDMPERPFSCRSFGGRPDIVLIGISAGRLSITAAASELDNDCGVGVHHLVSLKPLLLPPALIYDLEQLVPGGFGVVVDSDHTICGAAEHVAHQLMLATGKPVYVIGLKDRTAGFAPHLDNKTPTAAEIVAFVRSKL